MSQSKGGQSFGVNPMTNAANGMSGAFNLLGAAAQANKLNPAGGTYAPAQAAAAQAGVVPGYSPVTGGQAAQFGPAQGQAQGYDAALQQNPQAIANLMGRYTNPYESQVVQNTADQMQRSLQQAQMGNADAAIAAGAFGGGRHGVVEGVTNAEAIRNIGDMTAQLRQQGFNTAAGLAGQDISNLMQTGALNQAATNAARGFTADASNAMSQFNAAQRQQAAAANAAARDAMSQFNANSRNTAGQFNAEHLAQQNQYNAGLRQDMSQFNAASKNEAGRFNAANAIQNQQNYLNNLMGIASMGGNLAQASYGLGRDIQNQQMQQGAMTQQLMQQILAGGQSGFDQITQDPARMLQLRLAALGMNPLNNAVTTNTTEKTNPGWGAMFGNLLGAAGNMFSFNPITLPWG